MRGIANSLDSNLQTIKQHRLWAWMIFSILALAYLMVYFHRVEPAVVADPLMAEFGLSGVAMGYLAAIYFYVYMPCSCLYEFWGQHIYPTQCG